MDSEAFITQRKRLHYKTYHVMFVSLFSGEDSDSCFLVIMSTWLELGDSREASLIACSESQSEHSTHFTDPTYRTSHIIKIIVTCQGADCSKFYNESTTPCSTGDWCLRWRDSITKIHSTIWHSSWGVKSWELMTYFKIVLSYRKKVIQVLCMTFLPCLPLQSKNIKY